MKKNALVKSRIVKQVILWAMTFMMGFTPVVSGMTAMTVYAEETPSGTQESENKTTGKKVSEKQENGDYNEPAKTETSSEVYLDGVKVENIVDNPDATIDYTTIETTATIDTHYYVTDENGNKIQVAQVDENGQVIEKEDGAPKLVDLEVSAADVKVEEVKAIDLNQASENPEAFQQVDEEEIVIGYYQDGVFLEDPERTNPGSKEYVKASIIENADGTQVVVSEDVVKALQGEDVEGLSRETVYYLPGENGETVQLDKSQVEAQYESGEYVIDEKTGVLSITANKNESGEYFITVNDQPVVVPSSDVETKTTYIVKDSETQKEICEVDATTLNNIKAADYQVVNDMYVVKDKNDKDVYFTAEDWAIATGHNVTYEEVTKTYYVTGTRYGQETQQITIGDETYSITVDFWENEVIKRDPDRLVTFTEINGRIVVSVPYLLYGKDADGKEIWTEGTYTSTGDESILVSSIGTTNQATITIKYNPIITTTAEVTFDSSYSVEENVIKKIDDGSAEKPINSPDSKVPNEAGANGHYRHVDVLIDGTIQVADYHGNTITVDAKISDVKATVNLGSTDSIYKEYDLTFDSNLNQDENGKYWEYTSFPYEDTDGGRKYSILADHPILISAKVTYKNPVTGNEESFTYNVYVYPEMGDLNLCGNKANGGFDYMISSDAIAAAVKENMKYTPITKLETVSNDESFTAYNVPGEDVPTVDPQPTPDTPNPPAAASDEPAVLGATRALTTIEDEPTALADGAAVLGAVRSPKTSDSSNVWVWMTTFAASAMALGGWTFTTLFKKKK